jgi:hypothetical protein
MRKTGGGAAEHINMSSLEEKVFLLATLLIPVVNCTLYTIKNYLLNTTNKKLRNFDEINCVLFLFCISTVKFYISLQLNIL